MCARSACQLSTLVCFDALCPCRGILPHHLCPCAALHLHGPQGGVTALWTAAFNGKPDAVKRLAKLGANKEAANEVGGSRCG